nr:hypothetical protein BaRGS_017966 [Batillaria attramentaria]
MLVNCTDFCKTDKSYNSTDFHTAARNLLHEHVKIFTDVQFFNESDALKVMWGQGTEQDLQHVEKRVHSSKVPVSL